MQVNVFVCLATACLLGRAAASPAEASFNFTYGYSPAAITVNTVNYTDESGTPLMVHMQFCGTALCHGRCTVNHRHDAAALLSYSNLLCSLQGYLAYDNTTMVQRPAVVIIPDYDGIGPYELWRANLLAQLGYAGLQFGLNPSKTSLTYLPFLLKCAALFAAMTSCWCSAAFVADIYGVAQVQGPALTSAQSSMLDQMYLMDPELLLSRVGAGVAEVHIFVHVAFPT